MRFIIAYVIFMLSCLTAKGQNDSLLKAIELMPNDAYKAMAYRDMAADLMDASPDQSLLFSRQGLRLGRALKNDTVIERCNFMIGLAQDYLNAPDSAFYYYDMVLASAMKRGAANDVNNVIFSKGNTHYFQGQYAEAIAYYDTAMAYWAAVGNLERQSKVLNNMGIIYRIRNRYEKAIDVYLRSIQIKTELGDSLGLANSLTNLGKVYYHDDQLEASLAQYDRAMELYRYLNYAHEMATVKSLISGTLIAMDKFEEAEVLLKEALPLLSQRINLDFLAALQHMALIDRQKGNPAAAVERLMPYYELVKNTNRINSLMVYEEELAAGYRDLGDYERAHFHLNEYLKHFKASATESRNRLSEEMQTRFETNEKENTIRLQELEIEKNARQRQNILLGTALALLGLLAVVVFAIFKIRGNRKLAREKAKTEALLRDRETLLREIHHRVKNNLQVVSSLLSIQGREITDDKAQQAVNDSRNRVHSMALIHTFLYGEQHVSSIDMAQYITQLSDKLFNTYRVDHDQVQLHVQVENILLDVDTAIPVGLILNELITNALKYAYPDGREGNLWVALHESDGVLALQVRDDGVGVADDAASAKTTSFGMRLLNAFKQKLDATFEIVNDDGLRIDYLMRKYKIEEPH